MRGVGPLLGLSVELAGDPQHELEAGHEGGDGDRTGVRHSSFSALKM